MRKPMIFALAVCVLSVFCACSEPEEVKNSEVQNSYEAYDVLVEQLEAENYEMALAEFVKLAPDYAFLQEQYAEHKEQVVGEWISLGQEERPSVVLREDGTCVIGDNNLTWEVRLREMETEAVLTEAGDIEKGDSEAGNSDEEDLDADDADEEDTDKEDKEDKAQIEVDVKWENDPVIRLVFEWEPNYEMYSMHMGVYYETGICEFDSTSDVYYYKADSVSKVEINEENVWDYFEYLAFPVWYEDENGEVEDVAYKHFLCLKKEYADHSYAVAFEELSINKIKGQIVWVEN